MADNKVAVRTQSGEDLGTKSAEEFAKFLYEQSKQPNLKPRGEKH